MMFEIQYQFSQRASSDDLIDLTNATETDMRYYLFQGSLILMGNDKAIHIDWDWVPILDFSLSLIYISDTLLKKENGQEEFEFTESDERILFLKEGNLIKISSSFSDVSLDLNVNEFKIAINNFHKKGLADISANNKEIEKNLIFSGYLQEAERL